MTHHAIEGQLAVDHGRITIDGLYLDEEIRAALALDGDTLPAGRYIVALAPVPEGADA